MKTVPLDQTGSGVADANGNCTVVIGPTSMRESWQVSSVSISNSSSNATPRCTVYLNTLQNRIAVSSAGRSDYSKVSNVNLSTLDRLIFVWTSADVGSQCLATVGGEKSLP